MTDHSELYTLLPRPQVRGRSGTTATIDRALATITDGSRVFIAGGCGAPAAIVGAMAAQRDRWSALELVADYLLEPLAVFEFPGEPFRLISLQPSRAIDAMRDAGALGTVSSSLRHFGQVTRPDGPLALDVAIVHVSPPGPEGRFSLGASVGTPVELIAQAKLVIAQVNPQMPYTFGAAELERDEIDLLVDVDHPIVALPPDGIDALDAVSEQIGQNVAGEIADGSVLQFGVGAIPKAVLTALADHRDLGIHGGMIGDTVVDLHQSGALTGAHKTMWPGKMTVGAILGSAQAFAFADRNPELVMVPSTISHGPRTIANIDRFVAINSAIEVALDGSINAEMAGRRVLSGPGGQPDYAIGAAESRGGQSVVALPSTASRGTRSRIVAELAAGISVTVPRNFADIVVTEHGVAHLRGRTFAERAAALRAIAHPDLAI